MEFLGVGYQEILVILAILLVVVGPERMPGMAYQIGRAVRTLQQYARAVRDEFRDEFDYLDDQMKTLKGGVDDARTVLREQDREFRRELDAIAPAELTKETPSNVVPFGQLPPAPNGTAPAETMSANGTASAEAVSGNGTNPASADATDPAPDSPAPESAKEPLLF